MRVLKFTPTERFGSNMFVLISGSEAAVIDPSVEYSKVKKLAEIENLSFKYIILTHAHFDHMLEIDGWVANTSAEVIVGIGDAAALSDSYTNCYRLFSRLDSGYYGSYKAVKSGDALSLGDTKLTVIETPGHSRGSITISAGDKLFVGDTVFFGGSYGRTDLPGGDGAALFSSIKYICSLNGEKNVYCGHGPDTTLEEIKSNFI